MSPTTTVVRWSIHGVAPGSRSLSSMTTHAGRSRTRATLQPRAGDAILAVDYFGARHGAAWRAFQAGRQDTLLIEDHSHDPQSTWATSSTADYAFASLRKTMPISDGAILWSPRGRALPADAGRPCCRREFDEARGHGHQGRIPVGSRHRAVRLPGTAIGWGGRSPQRSDVSDRRVESPDPRVGRPGSLARAA